jgi:HlyD family secretion protein
MDRQIRTPWWRRKAVLAAGAVGGVLVLASSVAATMLAGMTSTVRVPATTVTLEVATPALFHDFTPVRAVVTPRDVIMLTAQDGGGVDSVLVHSGDEVSAGQPLVKFRNIELEMAFLDRQSQVVSSISGLESTAKGLEDSRLSNEQDAAKMAFDIDKLKTKLQQQQTLYDKGFGSRDAVDQLRAELALDLRMQPLQAESAERQEALRRKRAPEIEEEIANLREGLSVTRAKLDSLTLRAPAAGRLSDFEVNPGERRAAGDKIGRLTPSTGFKLLAGIDEYYLNRVRPGQTALMTLDAGGEAATTPARVTRVDPQVKDGVFQVELAFDRQPASLLTGQALEGRLSLGDDRRALILPAGAWLDTTGGDWAMVLAADGSRTDKRRIRVGRRNAEQVEVLAGIKPGERIITSSYAAFDKVERVQLSR